jgi:sulfite reductase (ferredoxin)
MAGKTYEDPRESNPLTVADHLGWHEQGDGLWYLGIPILSGRVADVGERKIRTGLRQLAEQFAPEFTVCATQDVVIGNVKAEDKEAITQLLKGHGMVLGKELTPLRRWSLACPALPTCNLAHAESERFHNPLLTQLETMMAEHGLEKEKFTLRMTGCPSGCARPYAGDVGLVGRAPNAYTLYVGGDFEGTRLSFELLNRVSGEGVVPILEQLLLHFKGHKLESEGFGDFCHRTGKEQLLKVVEGV